ncbi:M15 family metallopeptidase [Candidatus Woesearchaeota archaeon]|nr:M15 family metallopeptidase [Candidatus Woesearchaeota archaeon]
MKRRDLLLGIGIIGINLFAESSFGRELPYDRNFSVDELELIGKKHPKLYGEDHRLRRIVSEAFSEMKLEAEKDKIKLYPTSSYRDFNKQSQMWNREYESNIKENLSHDQLIKKTLKYYSIPGTSRHHWGTDIDVVDSSKVNENLPKLNPKQFEGGIFKELNKWIKENANRFGFYIVYDNNPKRDGFEYEPWHISYAELSIPLLKQYMETKIQKYIADKTVKGHTNFSREFVVNYKNTYGMDINPLLISLDTKRNR